MTLQKISQVAQLSRTIRFLRFLRLVFVNVWRGSNSVQFLRIGKW